MSKFLITLTLFISLFLISVNISYSQYERKVVFEEFTEVWCGPCASLSPMLSVWIDNHKNVIPIMYSSYFVENGVRVYVAKEDYDTRNKFYGVPFYPYGRLNGNALPPNASYPGFPTDTSAMSAVIDTMSKESPIKIELELVDNGGSGSVNANIFSGVNLNKKKLHIFILEKHHTFAKQSNGMTEFHDIFRESVTPATGEDITISANQELQFSFNYELSGNVNEELYAVAIIQDPVSHYIFQSERVTPTATSVQITNENDFMIYPNPAENTISVNSLHQNYDYFEICDLSGKTLLTSDENRTLDISDLISGTYYFRAISDNKITVRKFLKK